MQTLKHVVLFILLATALSVSACSLFTRDVQAKDSSGTPLFIGPDGKATSEPTGVNGQPNEPLMVPESSGVLEGVQKTAGGLPAPWGTILGAVAGVGTAALGAYVEAKRRKAERMIVEYEKRIDANPEARKAIDEKVWADLPEALKTRLEAVK